MVHIASISVRTYEDRESSRSSQIMGQYLNHLHNTFNYSLVCSRAEFSGEQLRSLILTMAFTEIPLTPTSYLLITNDVHVLLS